MIQLYVTLKGHNVGRFHLDKTEVRLGRNPENEVVLNNMAISRHHCSLLRGADGVWRVKDLSNNGTFLNGQRISGDTSVKDGDALGLGQFQVLIKTSAESLSPDEVTDVSRPELLELDAPLKGYLTRPGLKGNEVLIEQDVLQIGSAGDVDLRVDGPPKLALIVRGYGGIQLVNVAPGAAAVQVEGQDVTDRRWLRDGDGLQLGELSLIFHQGSPTGGEQTMEIHISALKLTPPAGLPEAAESKPPPPPPPPPQA